MPPHDRMVEKIIHSAPSRVMSRMLRELREEAGMRQEDLAAELDVVRQTVSAIERGERMLMVLELFDYLRPLGLKPSEFVARLEAEIARSDVEDKPI